jgi:hypothetical protein
MITNALPIKLRAQSNTFYAKAIAAVPGYLEAQARYERATEKRRSVLFPQVQWPALPTAESDDLDAYLDAYEAAWEEEQARNRRAEALDAVIGQANREMRTVLDDPDRLLRSLAEDFSDLMAAVANVVTRLKGATTPLQAINAGTSEVWRELQPLRETYDTIRRAQGFVNLELPPQNHRSEHITDELADDRHIGNLDTILPGWRDADNRYFMSDMVPDRRPWPTDPCEQLVWAITNDAEVWLPTQRQLAKVLAARARRMQPQSAEDPDLPREPAVMQRIR